MWFEILPSALIIFGAFNLSVYGTYGLHKYFLTNAHKRDMRLYYNRRIYLRDRRLMDNPYLMNGLETITGDPEGDFVPPSDSKSGGDIECSCPVGGPVPTQ